MTDEFNDGGDLSEFEPVLRRVGDAFEHALEPVPSHLAAAARSAFAWRLADQALAELLDDASADELVGIRGTSSDRRAFRYGAGDFVIRVHLTPATLIVMIEPPVSVACRVATAERIDAYRTDDLGELAVDAPDLPFRIEVDLPGGTTVTPWITG
jgi:hypothetical protein